MPRSPGFLPRQAQRATRARRAGGAPDASAIAGATLDTWRQMVARLAPVIGVRGVDVLFRRSLHLTSARFPWLVVAGDEAAGAAALLAALEARLTNRAPDVAAEASRALLVTFVELLAGIIGEPLTDRLLGAVWAPATPTSEPETES